MRIRRGTLSAGSAVPNLVNMEWNDNHEVDRTPSDLQFTGEPICMRKGGSGTIELLAGKIDSGYATADVVLTYKEVSLDGGVESTTDKTATFSGVTFNQGGSVPSEGAGRKRISFEYSSCVTG